LNKKTNPANFHVMQTVEQEFEQLYRDCQASCLWFWKKDQLPESPELRREALRQIEQHGTRSQFIQARKIKKWLLQNSSNTSAI